MLGYMSSLKHVDRLRLEKFLEMGGGYVCDFSDRTFGDFVMEATSVDVYSVEYEEGGTSKANRLRTFWKNEDDSVTAKLLKEIIEYQKIQKQTSKEEWNASNEELYRGCLDIANKIKGKSVISSNDAIRVKGRISGEYVLRDEIVKILLTKGYPEDSLHPAWKQGVDEFNLVIIDPTTKEILMVFLFELYTPNPVVISSTRIREIIRKFASLVIGPQVHLFLVSTTIGEDSFVVSKMLTHTRNCDLPIFVKIKDVPEFNTLGNIRKEVGISEKNIEQKYEFTNMSKSINEFTDEELLGVIRRAENTSVPGSQYQKAYNEWQIRHQQKMLEATKKHPQSGVFISAQNFENNGSISSNDPRATSKEGLPYLHKWNVVITIIGIVVTILLAIIGWKFYSSQTSIQNNAQIINSIQSIGQNGNNTIIGKTTRHLTESQKVILKNALSGAGERAAFMSKIFDPEAKIYAEQLSESFASAGWTIVAPLKLDLLDDFSGRVNIFKTGKSATTSLDVFLVEKIPAFDQAGISYESKIPRAGSFGGNLEEETLYIEVGSN